MYQIENRCRKKKEKRKQRFSLSAATSVDVSNVIYVNQTETKRGKITGKPGGVGGFSPTRFLPNLFFYEIKKDREKR